MANALAAGVTIVSPYRSNGEPALTGSSDSALNAYTQRLACALSEHTRTTVLAPKQTSEEPWDDNAIRVIPCFSRGRAIAPIEIAVAATRRRLSGLVHIQHELFAYGGVLGALCMPIALFWMRYLGCRVVTTIHGIIPLQTIDWDFVRRNGLWAPPRLTRYVWRSLLRVLCRFSDVVHVHENTHRDMLVSEYGVQSRIEVIPHGVSAVASPLGMKESARMDLGISPNEHVLLFFGYLSAYKGIEHLLDAIPTLLRRDPALRVVIAGDVPARLRGTSNIADRLRAAVEKFPTVSHVGFVPEQDVSKYFFAADCLILPYTVSMAASGPMALAIGHNLPVMLSDRFRGDFPECPTVFELSTAAIVRVVEQFFSDPNVRHRALAFVTALRDQRTYASAATQLQELYRSICAF